ncbi:MAG: helix-turn-helix domain-containing protein [Bacteriovoracia bacterium]
MKKRRADYVLETSETKALRAMREYRGISVRELGDLLKKSHTSIHSLENGKANVEASYVDAFLAALNFTRRDWETFKKAGEKIDELRHDCLRLLYEAHPERISAIHTFIKSNYKLLIIWLVV